MNRASFTLVSAAVACLATVAQAQTPALVEIDDKVVVEPFKVDVDRLEDMNVSNAQGQKIGEVDEVVGPDRNTPQALVIDFDENAGFGDRDDVIVPIERFSINGLNLVLEDDAETISGYEIYID